MRKPNGFILSYWTRGMVYINVKDKISVNYGSAARNEGLAKCPNFFCHLTPRKTSFPTERRLARPGAWQPGNLAQEFLLRCEWTLPTPWATQSADRGLKNHAMRKPFSGWVKLGGFQSHHGYSANLGTSEYSRLRVTFSTPENSPVV